MHRRLGGVNIPLGPVGTGGVTWNTLETHSFADVWRVDSVEETILEITISPEGAQAWLASFTRV